MAHETPEHVLSNKELVDDLVAHVSVFDAAITRADLSRATAAELLQLDGLLGELEHSLEQILLYADMM
jgi:hypothetical protein